MPMDDDVNLFLMTVQRKSKNGHKGAVKGAVAHIVSVL